MEREKGEGNGRAEQGEEGRSKREQGGGVASSPFYRESAFLVVAR